MPFLFKGGNMKNLWENVMILICSTLENYNKFEEEKNCEKALEEEVNQTIQELRFEEQAKMLN